MNLNKKKKTAPNSKDKIVRVKMLESKVKIVIFAFFLICKNNKIFYFIVFFFVLLRILREVKVKKEFHLKIKK